MKPPELDIVLPIHNEAEGIETVLREIDSALAGKISYRFVLCEDGSQDGTQKVLKSLQAKLPMHLMLSTERKGYSRAVFDGLAETSAPWVLCLDSDGQCDPMDLFQIWEKRESVDIFIGWRKKRADPIFRKILSRTFHALYQARFHIPVHDPSCPFVLIRRESLARFVGSLGLMKEGFWWEFIARAWASGCRLSEVPVKHRKRAFGVTRVYRIEKIPSIGWRHVKALYQIPRAPKTKQ